MTAFQPARGIQDHTWDYGAVSRVGCCLSLQGTSLRVLPVPEGAGTLFVEARLVDAGSKYIRLPL